MSCSVSIAKQGMHFHEPSHLHISFSLLQFLTNLDTKTTDSYP